MSTLAYSLLDSVTFVAKKINNTLWHETRFHRTTIFVKYNHKSINVLHILAAVVHISSHTDRFIFYFSIYAAEIIRNCKTNSHIFLMPAVFRRRRGGRHTLIRSYSVTLRVICVEYIFSRKKLLYFMQINISAQGAIV